MVMVFSVLVKSLCIFKTISKMGRPVYLDRRFLKVSILGAETSSAERRFRSGMVLKESAGKGLVFDTLLVQAMLASCSSISFQEVVCWVDVN